MALWAVYALMLLAVMVLLSVVLTAPAAASGAGVGVYAALLVLAQFEVTATRPPRACRRRGSPSSAASRRSGPAPW